MSGLRLDDGFAVQFQHQAQHAVRGRVLRTHVQDHGLGRAGRRLHRGGHQRNPSTG